MHTNHCCTIYLVRHGHSEGNEKGVFGTNPQLTDLGKKQAKELANHLKAIHFDAIFASTLTRAKQTAESIALERKIAVQTNELLKERYWGEFEGRLQKEVQQELGHLFEEMKNLNQKERVTYKLAPHVETQEAMIARFITALREIAVAYTGKNQVSSEDAQRRALEERLKADEENQVRSIMQQVREGHLSKARAAYMLQMNPQMFDVIVAIDAKLTAFKKETNPAARNAVVESILKQCVDLKPHLREEDLDAFVDSYVEITRPDVTDDERSEIIGRLKEREAKQAKEENRPEMSEEQLHPKEREELEQDLREVKEVVKVNPLQKLGWWTDDKVLQPTMRWLERKQHQLEHWLKPDEPLKAWSMRGLKFLLALVKYTLYYVLMMSKLINQASGRGSK